MPPNQMSGLTMRTLIITSLKSTSENQGMHACDPCWLHFELHLQKTACIPEMLLWCELS